MLLSKEDEFIIAGMIKKYKLQKTANKKWAMCCPFHNEITPSFSLNTSTGEFHCFGCSKSGTWDDLVAIKEKFL